MMNNLTFLDCTLRDGGYYNAWDFDYATIQNYINAVAVAGVDIIELGFRSLKNGGFKGACFYTGDEFIRSLQIPENIQIGVMINGSEILVDGVCSEQALAALFPESTTKSPVNLVRIACHTHEFREGLNACEWLKSRGYLVGFNLMQVGERSNKELEALAKAAAQYPVDALYFADSLGNMTPDRVCEIVIALRTHWRGILGVHTHDNMGLALSNTLRAIDEGITWLDSTVMGMGRGAGNAKTELLAIEIAELRGSKCNITPLMSLISEVFEPMKSEYHWGANAFYYLSGKHGIHPTYIQEMMADSRYTEEDILAVIEYLRVEGGTNYSSNRLRNARHFYSGKPHGSWHPQKMFSGKEVLLLGSGPGALKHKVAIESYIKKAKPLVMALNTQSTIEEDLIDVRVACHPVRLLADCELLAKLPQPLITPASMLPSEVSGAMSSVELLDYGLSVESDNLVYEECYCILPNSLVISYALAVACSGKALRVLLAGFDGYSAGDPRRLETDQIFQIHQSTAVVPLLAVTPTLYRLDAKSIYAL